MIEIKLGERNLTVHTLTLPMALERTELQNEYEAMPPRENKFEELTIGLWYASLVATTTGWKPTHDEFVAIPYKQLDTWYQAVIELNPELEIKPQPDPKQEEEKKSLL